jgi:2-methylcitrate synthase
MNTTTKPKKSVALSGVVAGNTAICAPSAAPATICTIAATTSATSPPTATFEEVAYLLLHGSCPRAAELAPTSASCVRCAACRRPFAPCSNSCRPPAIRWTCCAPASRRWAAPCRRRTGTRRARATSPTGCSPPRLDAALLVSLQRATGSASRSRPTMIRSPGTSCICCMAQAPAEWVRAMHTSLILYAEHEFNASTFTARVIAGTGSDMYSCITGAIGALRGPKHGGANEVASKIQSRYARPMRPRPTSAPRRRQRSHHRLRPSGLHDLRSAQQMIKKVARELAPSAGDPPVRTSPSARIRDVGVKRMFPNLDWFSRRELSPDGRADRDVHAAVRDRAHLRLGRARHRAAPTARSSARAPTTSAPTIRRSCRSRASA